MSKQRNFYEVLNSTPNSTFDELKSNYKLLILQCHPDKLQQDNKAKEETTNVTTAGASTTAGTATVDPNVSAADDNAAFVMINKAWNTLKDPIKRKHYDAELLLTKFQMHSNIFEHLTLDDMVEQVEETDEEEVSETQEISNVEEVKNECQKNIEQTKKNDDNAEDLSESAATKSVSYFYTYNCRCGGQYVIDESAAADNGIYKSNKNINNSNKMLASQRQQNKTQNDCDNVGDKDDEAAAGTGAGVSDASTVDVEVMVECNECSLVILLSNKKPKTEATDSTLLTTTTTTS